MPSLLGELMLIDRNKGSLRKQGNISEEIVPCSLQGASLGAEVFKIVSSISQEKNKAVGKEGILHVYFLQSSRSLPF